MWFERSRFGSSRWIPFGRYARLVGAPKYTPSLCSVAGLLLALALESGLRGPIASPALVNPIQDAVKLRGPCFEYRSDCAPRARNHQLEVRAGRPEPALGLCVAAPHGACSYGAIWERRGVLVAALQSEREEDTATRPEQRSLGN